MVGCCVTVCGDSLAFAMSSAEVRWNPMRARWRSTSLPGELEFVRELTPRVLQTVGFVLAPEGNKDV